MSEDTTKFALSEEMTEALELRKRFVPIKGEPHYEVVKCEKEEVK